MRTNPAGLSDVARLTVRLARDDDDLRAAQRLRYEVFIAEMGGDGPLVDHANRLERDHFDPFYDHLLLLDESACRDTEKHVVGAYRLMPGDRLDQCGRFYSEDEYDLGCLRNSGRRLLELGRSCVAPAYRGGGAMMLLWQALSDYVISQRIEILFGVASFHGTDPRALAQPLGFLHHYHLAPPEIRVISRCHERMDAISPDMIDRKQALLQMPSLIRAYLRIGGVVGDGAFIDHAFGTTDVCLVLDTARMKGSFRQLSGRSVTGT